jgi:RHS repeat-associated protein
LAFPSGPVTIDYTYDDLNRLTEANYTLPGTGSDNRFYHYGYDAVGNRVSASDLYGATTYGYDTANRLTGIDGVSQTWDNNGNLLNDGVNTYTYDPANRLSTVSGSAPTVSYAYNGLGDRLQQTIGSNTTTYLMDLNAGLSQVLDDGTNAYIYGNGRIAQIDATTQYFLGDALGSVRQVTSAAGNIVLARSYDPYGNPVASAGTAQTSYGFDAEQTDSNGLVYLRARHYAPDMGRFMSRDTWQGDDRQPMSYNRWNYTDGNPVNRLDPSGQCWVTVSGSSGLVWVSDGTTPCPLIQGLTLGKVGTLPAGAANGAIYVQAYGGAQLAAIYNMMTTCNSAWWNEELFDVDSFIGLMLLSEANFAFKDKDPNGTTHGTYADNRLKALVTVAATVVYEGGGNGNWKCDQSKEGNCLASVLNYFAAYSAVSKSMILDYYQATGNPAGFDHVLNGWLNSGPLNAAHSLPPQLHEILQVAHQAGLDARNSNNAMPGGPTEYGNYDKDFAIFIKGCVGSGSENTFGGTGKKEVYYYVDDFFVWTKDQEDYWKTQWVRRSCK